MRHEYIYSQDAERYAFVAIPVTIIKEEAYKGISTDAKLLYALMLNRVRLSRKNNWLDKMGRVYIYYTQAAIMEDLNCANAKATKLMKELESMDLIERKRQGLGKPMIIYVKDFVIHTDEESSERAKENMDPLQDQEEEEIEHDNHESGQLIIKSAETWETNTNKSESSELEEESIPSDLIEDQEQKGYHDDSKVSIDRGETVPRERSWYQAFFAKSLSLDALRHDNAEEAKRAEELIDLLADTCASRKPYLYLGGDRKPMEHARDVFLKLDRNHLLYVLDSLEKNTSKIRNMKQYLLATLYNAPMTINNYYRSSVNHDQYAAS